MIMCGGGRAVTRGEELAVGEMNVTRVVLTRGRRDGCSVLSNDGGTDG